jgi:hypothetical protein
MFGKEISVRCISCIDLFLGLRLSVLLSAVVFPFIIFIIVTIIIIIIFIVDL